MTPVFTPQDDTDIIDDLGSGAMYVGGIETVDLSGLEHLIIALEASGSDQEVEV